MNTFLLKLGESNKSAQYTAQYLDIFTPNLTSIRIGSVLTFYNVKS